MLANEPHHEVLVADVAERERGLRRDRPAKSRRQVVEHDDLLAGVDEFENHVAADITGAARHKYRHRRVSAPFAAGRRLHAGGTLSQSARP